MSAGDAPTRLKHDRAWRERGAGTVEYVGVTVVGVVLCLGLLLTPVGNELGSSFVNSVCRVVTQSECASTDSSGGDESDRTPYERATAGRYVALGDSYSSGEGAWDYEDGTDFDDRDDLWPFNDDEEEHNRCHRSAYAYSQVLVSQNTFEGGFTFAACSGAEMPELADANPDNTGEQPQLDWLDDDVSLVTMSLGGNDLGFADVLKDCILNGERGVPGVSSCQEKHEQRIQEELPQLKAELIAQYERIQAAAPEARVVIVGYPALFVEDPSDNYGNLLFEEDQAWMNEQAAELNAMLRAAADEAGVEFVDPTDVFRGHGIGSDDPWLNDLDFGGPGMMIVDPSSFHPNAAGHSAIAKLLQEQLEEPRYLPVEPND